MTAIRPAVLLEYEEMIKALDKIWGSDEEDKGIYKASIFLIQHSIYRLSEMVRNNDFENDAEEINYFKELKPLFVSKYIFYTHLFRIEVSALKTNSRFSGSFLDAEKSRIRLNLKNNLAFYQYYRSESTHYDHIYFLRRSRNLRVLTSLAISGSDDECSTGYDFEVSKILADDLLNDWLEQEFKKLEIKDSVVNKPQTDFNWTAPKVGLAELLYAFQASGVLNHSRTETRKTADYLSKAFNIELGNVYKIFEEIRLRKKNRTAFLDSLKQQLIRKMDEDDLNADKFIFHSCEKL